MTTPKLVAIIAAAVLVGALAVAGIGTAYALGPGGQSCGPSGVTAGPNGPGGMMGGAYGRGMMGGWAGQQPQNQGEPLSIDQAIKSAQAYVDQYGNKDLVLDEAMEFQYNFYLIVKEKSTGIGAFELLVDKYSGSVYPEHGPNMMWNVKYGMMSGGAGGMMRGMMGGMMGGRFAPTNQSGPMTVTSEQASTAAQRWLDQNQPGSTTEKPDQFYGYYTVHTLKAGQVTGMLSVNGYDGQVWYHSWHGTFVQQKELGQ
jgi:hypothetical protein